MHRLTWTIAARIGDKYQIRLTRPMYILKTEICLSIGPYFAEGAFQGMWAELANALDDFLFSKQ